MTKSRNAAWILADVLLIVAGTIAGTSGKYGSLVICTLAIVACNSAWRADEARQNGETA